MALLLFHHKGAPNTVECSEKAEKIMDVMERLLWSWLSVCVRVCVGESIRDIYIYMLMRKGKNNAMETTAIFCM